MVKRSKFSSKMRKNRKKSTLSIEGVKKNTSELKKYNITDKKLKMESPALDLKKKIWLFDDLLEAMEPTAEELDYRKEKLKEPDFLQKNSELVKCSKCQTDMKLTIIEDKEVPTHPCLGVLMCRNCCNYYEDGEFSLDSDGEDKYCRWCGEGGLIFSCSKCICGFCATCLKRHFETDFLKKVKKNEDWLCFFCNPKPLWGHRFICSVAAEISENAETGTFSRNLSKNKTVTKSGRLSTKKSITDIPENTKTEVKKERRKKFFTSKLKGKHESSSLTAVKHKINGDFELEITPKKMRFHIDPILIRGFKEIDNDCIENAESDILKGLKKIIQLFKHQMSFGISWSNAMVEKLENSDSVASPKELVKECQKIKWFLSVLSTYLIQFSNSVESIEKVLTSDEGQRNQQNVSGKDVFYNNILKFLSFVTSQVHIFKENGMSLPDIMATEMYNDDKIMGLKKNSKSSSVSSSISVNSESDNRENKEESSSHECDADKDVDTAKLEEDLTKEKKETCCKNKSEYDLDKQNSVLQELDELKTVDLKDDIQKVLAILENA